MITKLLDGLEMFLGVGVMFLNSSNSKMAGGWHIYRPPSEESRLGAVTQLSGWRRIDRRWVTGSSGHTEPQGSRWGL